MQQNTTENLEYSPHPCLGPINKYSHLEGSELTFPFYFVQLEGAKNVKVLK